MAVSRQERERVRGLDLPSTALTEKAIRDYLARSGMSAADFAERIGYSPAAVNAFLQGSYGARASTDAHLRAAAWEFMRRRPVKVGVRAEGRLFETENVRRIRVYFQAAVERGEICLLYGPPGTQKSFTLEHLIAERHRAGQDDALYVYASVGMTPFGLMRRLMRQAGLHLGGFKEQVTANFLSWAAGREKPPAVIIDEAQHLSKDALEQARELNDLGGCGLILAGSHNLYEDMLKNRRWLEQWISRQDHKEPLPGLLESEVREIAARELGSANGGQPARLSEKQLQSFLDASRVDDFFSRNEQGKPEPRKYYSVRRLTKVLNQVKASKTRAA